MNLEKRLTSDFLETAGLATIDEYNEYVPNGSFRPGVLKRFAEQLEDVDDPVEVSIQTLDYADDKGSEKALVGRVEGTDVACVAAPIRSEDGGDA